MLAKKGLVKEQTKALWKTTESTNHAAC